MSEVQKRSLIQQLEVSERLVKCVYRLSLLKDIDLEYSNKIYEYSMKGVIYARA
jgi:hypothetical protein